MARRILVFAATAMITCAKNPAGGRSGGNSPRYGAMRLNNPFEVFCWYYLGLSPQGQYRFTNANQIAKHYSCTVAELLEFLQTHNMHPDTVLNTDFPMARHQVDIQLAAEERGPELAFEMAGKVYSQFQGRLGNRRDWLAEIKSEQDESGTKYS